MILIDIPVIAYETWSIACRIYDENGNRDRSAEWEMERNLKSELTRYEYSAENKHV